MPNITKKDISRTIKVQWTVRPFPLFLKNSFASACKMKGITVPELLAEVLVEWLIKNGYEEFIN